LKFNKSTIFVFILIYTLFSLSGFLYPVDQQWYMSISKPSWTPPGFLIGIVWAILFALISLSVSIIYERYGLNRMTNIFVSTLTLNYIFNQAFSYFQFSLHNLLLSAVDTTLVATTALLLVIFAWRYSTFASFLLIPYFIWSCFASVLSFSIYFMN
jgi:translocator protein